MKENATQKAILEWLAWKHVFHYRNNSGAFAIPETATHARRFFRAGTVGAPDIICVVGGRYIGIEVKAPKGMQSENQKEFQRQLEDAGGKYILAYSIDDVERGLSDISPSGQVRCCDWGSVEPCDAT